jgi:hypothetical protein
LITIWDRISPLLEVGKKQRIHYPLRNCGIC